MSTTDATAPLTAGEIAAIRDQLCGIPDDGDYNPQHYAGMEAVEKGVLDRLTSSHEALRDRLAAAQGRITALEEELEGALDMIEDQFPEPDPYTASIVEPGRTLLAHASTDGAARGGEGRPQ